MNHDQKSRLPRNAAPQLLSVRFDYADPDAGVYIARTVNNWRPHAKPMCAVGSHRWLREAILPIGLYEYCLVVDGDFLSAPPIGEPVPDSFRCDSISR